MNLEIALSNTIHLQVLIYLNLQKVAEFIFEQTLTDASNCFP